MPSRRFFCLLKGARSYRFKKQGAHYYELCQIATITKTSTDWSEKMAAHYWSRVVPAPKTDDNEDLRARQFVAMLGAFGG